MYAKMKTLLVLTTLLGVYLFAVGQVQSIDVPSRKPQIVVAPEKPSGRPDELQPLPEKKSRVLEDDDSFDGAEEEVEDDDEIERKADGEGPQQTGDEASANAGETTPPMPERAPIPSMRNPRIASEAYGPPILETWSAAQIRDARQICEKQVSEDKLGFDFVDPIRDGVCGAPAPIAVSMVTLKPDTEIRPAAIVRCPFADALNRWVTEVVQPRAAELLNDRIVRLTNVASYHCRTRYNAPGQRMSHHAFANALDISAFETEKGEVITLTKHWEGDEPPAKFLKAVHEGACKMFGTVLGPDANAAHRDHFHFDMAKRRRNSYCR
ncbi:MAG: extensin family protein [Rhodomicrobiaceae bacterium]